MAGMREIAFRSSEISQSIPQHRPDAANAEEIDNPVGQMLRQLVAQHGNDHFISRGDDLLDAVLAHYLFANSATALEEGRSASLRYVVMRSVSRSKLPRSGERSGNVVPAAFSSFRRKGA